MPITLTCSCGQRQFVAVELAGQKWACVGCGKALSVPALGVLIPPKSRAKMAEPPRAAASSRRAGVVLLIAGAILLLLGVGGGIAWHAFETPLPEAKEFTQAKETEPEEKRQRDTPLDKPKPVQPRKTEKPAPVPIVQPKPLADVPMPVVGEPIKPAIEPVKPIVIEPIKPAIEPVKPVIVEPVKPKEKDPPPPVVVAKKEEPLKLVWKLKEGDTFFQELIVTQKPTFRVQGIAVASMLQYRVISRFTVQKAGDDGSLIVQQKVESAKLLQADALTQSALGGAVAQMPGTTYTVHLNPKGEVTHFKSGAALMPLAVQLAGGQGMQMASLLDRDGWRELAERTFFQMDQSPRPDLRWSRPMKHNWGALGSWGGQIHYAYLGQHNAIHKIAYGLQLSHKPPAAGAVVGGMNVTGANFQPQEAGGVLVFDAARGRVVSAEERFRVKGVLNANLLGQNTVIEIDEHQHFLIRIHDKIVP